MNKLMYRFVATRKKKKRNRPVFRHGMPLQGIPRNKDNTMKSLVVGKTRDNQVPQPECVMVFISRKPGGRDREQSRNVISRQK